MLVRWDFVWLNINFFGRCFLWIKIAKVSCLDWEPVLINVDCEYTVGFRLKSYRVGWNVYVGKKS